MSVDLEEQYDKIYRYCYFKVREQNLAEDITQETFLRFIKKYGYLEEEWVLRYLYKIAHNLCIDEYKKQFKQEITKEMAEESFENEVLNKVTVQNAMSTLSEEEKEMLLLRYVNEVPVTIVGNLFHMSRFAVYRKIKRALEKLQIELGEGE